MKLNYKEAMYEEGGGMLRVNIVTEGQTVSKNL